MLDLKHNNLIKFIIIYDSLCLKCEFCYNFFNKNIIKIKDAINVRKYFLEFNNEMI